MYVNGMDPALLTVIASAFGGAIITGLIALITHALTGRREQKKWLLDQKYKVYVSFLRDIEALRRNQDAAFNVQLANISNVDLPQVSLMTIQEILLLAHDRLAHRVLLWSRTQVALSELVKDAWEPIHEQLKSDPSILTRSLPLTREIQAAQAAESAASFAVIKAVRKELKLTEPFYDRVHGWLRKRKQESNLGT